GVGRERAAGAETGRQPRRDERLVDGPRPPVGGKTDHEQEGGVAADVEDGGGVERRGGARARHAGDSHAAAGPRGETPDSPAAAGTSSCAVARQRASSARARSASASFLSRPRSPCASGGKRP